MYYIQFDSTYYNIGVTTYCYLINGKSLEFRFRDGKLDSVFVDISLCKLINAKRVMQVFKERFTGSPKAVQSKMATFCINLCYYNS